MKSGNVTIGQAFKHFLVLLCLFAGPVHAQNYNDSLLDGAWSGNTEKVKRAILHHADLNHKLLDGATALHYACGGNHLSVVSVLVSAGANVNLVDKAGRTPIHIAALNGNDSIGEYLIVNGAGLSTRNEDGLTPLMVAVSSGNFVFSDMCLYYGSDIRLRPADSSSVCHLSVHHGNPYLLQMLVDRGAEIDICDRTGKTPLMYAVMYNDTSCAGILMRAGATKQPACFGSSKTNLLELAVDNGCESTLLFLLNDSNGYSKPELKAVRDNAIRLDNREVIKAFRGDSIPMSLRPVFQGILFKPELFINFRDHFFGFSLGTMEMKSKIGFEFGLATRLWKKRVLYIQESSGETLQLQEKRGFVYFGQYKAVRLFQKKYSGLQIEPGIQENYTWAYFDGMSAKPWRGWSISPTFDVVWFGKYWNVSLGARYFAFQNTLPGFYFSLSGGWVIPFKK